MRTVPPFADFAPLPLRSEDSAAREGDWLLHHEVGEAGRGVVPNNGTLRRASLRPSVETRADRARTEPTVDWWAPPCARSPESNNCGEGKLPALLPLVGTTHPCSLRSLSPPTPLRRLRSAGWVSPLCSLPLPLRYAGGVPGPAAIMWSKLSRKA